MRQYLGAMFNWGSFRGVIDRSLFCALALLLGISRAVAQEESLFDTPIEELMNMEITSVSKVTEIFKTAPSALFVLTNSEIRRSGATNIPEALRLVPGVQVAQIDANKWSVSARGFNGRAANKLLVLLDGRNIYDLLFSGVLWEVKDVVLEDVDRIEVIRGPGGTIWGANAVNGVINIITKSAKETQGGLVSGGVGNELKGFGVTRYGTKIGQDSYFRIYGKYKNIDNGYLDEGANDQSEIGQLGFRLDSDLSKHDQLSLSANFYDGNYGSLSQSPMSYETASGASVLGRWDHKIGNTSKLNLVGYYDHTEIDTFGISEIRDTFNLESVYSFRLFDSNDFVTGLNLRTSSDELSGQLQQVQFDPPSRTDHFLSAFIQDKISLFDSGVFLTLGSKVEHNEYTGSEYEPSVRLSWNIDSRRSLWASISQAVRVPSRLEDDLLVTLGPGQQFKSGDKFQSENLTAYELGFRNQLLDETILDVSTFFNVYDDLLSTEGLMFGNKSSGNTYGVEIATRSNLAHWWRLDLAYTYLEMELELDDDSLDNYQTRISAVEGANPTHQASLRSSMDLVESWHFDFDLRFVDSLPGLDVNSYLTGGARVAYDLYDSLEIAVVGQNLFQSRHFEQGGETATQVQRGVYGSMILRF